MRAIRARDGRRRRGRSPRDRARDRARGCRRCGRHRRARAFRRGSLRAVPPARVPGRGGRCEQALPSPILWIAPACEACTARCLGVHGSGRCFVGSREGRGISLGDGLRKESAQRSRLARSDPRGSVAGKIPSDCVACVAVVRSRDARDGHARRARKVPSGEVGRRHRFGAAPMSPRSDRPGGASSSTGRMVVRVEDHAPARKSATVHPDWQAERPPVPRVRPCLRPQEAVSGLFTAS